MGFLDFLLGKDPKDSLPPWLKTFLNSPPPQGYMDYLQNGMPTGSSSSSSSLTSGYSNTRGNTFNQYSNQPFVTRDFAPLVTQMRDQVSMDLARGGLPEGYIPEGLRNIGQAAKIQQSALQGDLTRRGLGGLTAAGSDVLAGQTMGNQASFLNQAPIVAQEQLYQTIMPQGQSLAGMFGRGEMGQSRGTNNSTTNSRSQTDSSSSSSGPPSYAGYEGIMSGLMPYMMSGRQGGLLSALPTIAGLIPGLGLFGGGAKKPTAPMPWLPPNSGYW